MAHPYTIGCFAIILDEEKRVLLCHRTDVDIWNLPGGGMEQGELPTEAVIRETYEETGLRVKVKKLLGIYGKPDRDDLVMTFECKVIGGKLRLNREADGLSYFPVDALPDNIMPRHVDRIWDAMKSENRVIIRRQRRPASRKHRLLLGDNGMEKRILGRTGLEITRLGVGLSEIGFGLTRDQVDHASKVLNLALDNGINFLDTSACYDISEELIGETVSHRRDEYILATKCGHVTGGYEGEAWTRQTILDSIDRSLRRMKTDYVDLIQLHTCGVDVLEKGEVITALKDAQQAGKARFIGYSGDNEAAAWAVASGEFDTLQTSFNLTDQQARTKLFEPARAQNMGIIVKRPIANGAWGAVSSPSDYAEQYWHRAQKMLEQGPIPGAPDHRVLLALGFAFAHEEVSTFIVGTKNPQHMLANIEWVNTRLPISAEAVAELHTRFDAFGEEWRQLS